MSQKLLACDIDGTLILSHNQHIHQKDIDAIKKWREKGDLFVLCTGRTLTWTIPILEHFHLHVDGLILCNGSMVYKVAPENHLDIKEIANTNIPTHIGIEIIEYFYQLEDFFMYWDDGAQTYEIEDRTFDQKFSIVQENYSHFISFPNVPQIQSSFATIGIAPLSGNWGNTDQIQKEINSRWGEYVDTFRNQFFIDIAPKESSKGRGIEIFQSFSPDTKAYGIGDSYNDLPMFQTVGKDHAFLMNNGEDTLKEYTGYTVASVAECIDTLLSNH